MNRSVRVSSTTVVGTEAMIANRLGALGELSAVTARATKKEPLLLARGVAGPLASRASSARRKMTSAGRFDSPDRPSWCSRSARTRVTFSLKAALGEVLGVELLHGHDHADHPLVAVGKPHRHPVDAHGQRPPGDDDDRAGHRLVAWPRR